MATYGYIRVSTVEQTEGTSLDEQRRKLQAIADLRGETLSEVFADEGVSGATPLEGRPAGQALLDTVQPGDVILIAKLDRGFRSAADALAKADWFRDIDVALVLADIGTDPVTSNGVGKLFFTMLAGLAEFERERIRERTAEGRAAKKLKGGHVGGKVPFGYAKVGSGRDAKLEPIEEQQALIPVILDCRGMGMSLRATADYLQAEHGVTLSHTAVSRVERDASREEA